MCQNPSFISTSELEMDVRSRLSDKSTSSQDDDVKGDVSSTDEVETIPKPTPSKRLQRVTRLKRKH